MTSTERPLPNIIMLRLLDAAERGLLSHGYKGASIRRITQEAGTHVASVSYHFGSKQALFAALFRRRLDALTHQRSEALRAIEARTEYSVDDVVQAYFDALFLLPGRAGRDVLGVIRTLLMPDPEVSQLASECIDGDYIGLRRRYALALAPVIRDVPVEEIDWRLDIMERFALCAITSPNISWASGSKGSPDAAAIHRWAALAGRLVPMLRAGMEAPISLHQDPPPFGGS